MAMTKTDMAYVAYFPESYFKENAASFLYSNPIGVGPLVFIEREDAPVKCCSGLSG